MRRKMNRSIALVISVIMLLGMTACSNSPAPTSAYGDASNPLPVSSSQETVSATGQIYLYGEQHAVDKILDKEFALWSAYYENEHMRHLFIEVPYYAAEFLNLWMQSDHDEILDALYEDWTGSAMHAPVVKEFYQKIKHACPETVFHGTDVGHQYSSTGERFLAYLEINAMKGSDSYLRTQEAIDQGKYFYEHSDDVYRENKMAENFIREFDAIYPENVMGIYGTAHTGLEATVMETRSGSVPCMANQLQACYGDAVNSEDLTWMIKDIAPIRTDKMTINGTVYTASYFGKEDMTGFKDFAYREFWRLENAYDDFKDQRKTGNVLPYDNYLMLIETGQVFVLDFGMTDGSVVRQYYRSDGNTWEGRMTTEEFTIE